MASIKKILLAIGAAAVIVMVAAFLYSSKLYNFKTAEKQSTAPATVTFQPEIPINEYWYFNQFTGPFNGFSLYVNNTDRNVIYALDDHGKIAWTIWGKDYGFARPEIRQNRDHLFVTTIGEDALKNYQKTLWVFDGNGRLAWKQTFMGGIDMPQMQITPKGYVILENYSSEVCDAGCGIMCSKKTTEKCAENAIWAFDLATGRVIWKNTTRNYYGTYFDSVDDSKLTVHSGGIGRGRFSHAYEINTETGIIEEHRVRLIDAELSENKTYNLLYDEKKQKLFFAKSAVNGYVDPANPEVEWSLSSGAPLYDLASKHANGSNLLFRSLDKIIVAQEYNANNIVLTYAFDKSNGTLLWKKDIDSKTFYNDSLKSVGDVVVMGMIYTSVCSYGCPTDSFICGHTEQGDRAYHDCQNAERNKPGYHASEVVAVDSRTGRILWKKLLDKNPWYVYHNLWKIDEKPLPPGVVKLYRFVENWEEEKMLLNARTGQVVKSE